MNRSSSEKGVSERIYNLIKIRAYSFHCTTGLPYDELISEGLLIYVRCLNSWKRDSGVKFTTYLYSCLNNELIQFCDTWRKQLPAILLSSEDEVLEPTYIESFNERMDLKRILSKISPAAQGVFTLLQECADEIIKEVGVKVQSPHAKKHLKGALRRYLIKLGWRTNDIDLAFGELAKVASSI